MDEMKLEPCPFCGADMNAEHGYADYVLSPNLAGANRSCWKCGAAGPSVFTGDPNWQNVADRLWNERAR